MLEQKPLAPKQWNSPHSDICHIQSSHAFKTYGYIVCIAFKSYANNTVTSDFEFCLLGGGGVGGMNVLNCYEWLSFRKKGKTFKKNI